MDGVTITFPVVEELTLKGKKDGKIVVQFETTLAPGDVGRLWNLQKYGGMRAMIISPQAVLDLKFETIDTRTGDVRK